MINMKKIIYSIIVAVGILSVMSCEDMLEVENTSMAQNPALNEKTDSVFFALGIAEAIQELADQYYFIGEMRGDLVATNSSTDANLRELYNYSLSETNKYVRANSYYKVINNCNYYLANRDTTLYTGAENVTINEYAAVAAWRAWVYLTLVRTYGKVPLVTSPLTAISDISDDKFEKCGIEEIVEKLAPELEKYSAMSVGVPTFATASYPIGTTNWGVAKTMNPSKIFVPVDVILGELYLENGEYQKAAQKYCKYLGENKILPIPYTASERINEYLQQGSMKEDCANGGAFYLGLDWNEIFASTTNDEIISYVPMAVSSQMGTTTDVPLAYGYDYYQLSKSSFCPRIDDIQIDVSANYRAIADTMPVYYYSETAALIAASNGEMAYPDSIGIVRGDARANYGTSTHDDYMFNRLANDTTKQYIRKNSFANIYLYRVATIYLHLAEAFNGMGYPELAFAVLKNGISADLKSLIEDGEHDYCYLPQEAYNVLTTSVPFLTTYQPVFGEVDGTNNYNKIAGMHIRGAGYITSGGEYDEKGSIQINMKSTANNTSLSSKLNLHYLPKPRIEERLCAIEKNYGVSTGKEKEDYEAAMLDILCDEYAMEFAFEGTRFYDLQRIARHFNQMGVFGGNFGDIWLEKKLSNRGKLVNTSNCYMPFK